MMTNFNSYINLSICWSICFLVWGSSGNDGEYKSCHWADQYSNQKTWPVFPWNGRWRFSPHATAIKVTISCLPVGLMEDIRLYITFCVNISSKLSQTRVQILVPWFERLVVFTSCLLFDWEKDEKWNIFRISRVEYGRKRKSASVFTTLLNSLERLRGHIDRNTDNFSQKTLPEKGRKMIRWFFWLFIFGLSFWSRHLCVNSLC